MSGKFVILSKYNMLLSNQQIKEVNKLDKLPSKRKIGKKMHEFMLRQIFQHKIAMLVIIIMCSHISMKHSVMKLWFLEIQMHLVIPTCYSLSARFCSARLNSLKSVYLLMTFAKYFAAFGRYWTIIPQNYFLREKAWYSLRAALVKKVPII